MPSPTQNAFMDRMRQMMFRGPVHRSSPAPEPARPDYNEQPSADEAVQIPVGLDGNPIFRPSASLRTSETQTIDWQRIAEQVQRGEHRLGRDDRLISQDEADLMRYHQQAPQPSERSLTRERLRYAAERLRSGVVSTPWHEAPEWLAHREDGFYLQGPMEPGGAIEAQVKKAGITCIVLPSISLESGQVEYRKHSVEPTNGAQRTEFEEFAMAEIRNWARKGFPGDIRK